MINYSTEILSSFEPLRPSPHRLELKIKDPMMLQDCTKLVAVRLNEVTILTSCGGVRGVMVIVVGNGDGDPSSDFGRGYLYFKGKV